MGLESTEPPGNRETPTPDWIKELLKDVPPLGEGDEVLDPKDAMAYAQSADEWIRPQISISAKAVNCPLPQVALGLGELEARLVDHLEEIDALPQGDQVRLQWFEERTIISRIMEIPGLGVREVSFTHLIGPEQNRQFLPETGIDTPNTLNINPLNDGYGLSKSRVALLTDNTKVGKVVFSYDQGRFEPKAIVSGEEDFSVYRAGLEGLLETFEAH